VYSLIRIAVFIFLVRAVKCCLKLLLHMLLLLYTVSPHLVGICTCNRRASPRAFDASQQQTTHNSVRLDSVPFTSSITAYTLHNATNNQTLVARPTPRTCRPAPYAVHVSASSRRAQDRGTKEQPACRLTPAVQVVLSHKALMHSSATSTSTGAGLSSRLS
jgi:hypothetical protein